MTVTVIVMMTDIDSDSVSACDITGAIRSEHISSFVVTGFIDSYSTMMFFIQETIFATANCCPSQWNPLSDVHLPANGGKHRLLIQRQEASVLNGNQYRSSMNE